MDYTLGEDGHQVEEIYSFPSTDRWANKSSKQDIGSSFEGLQSKHSKTWDKNLIYIQHSYNKAVHTSTGKSPFETCFEYSSPSPLEVIYGQQGEMTKDITRDALDAKKNC
jgi:hypothetical protein